MFWRVVISVAIIEGLLCVLPMVLAEMITLLRLYGLLAASPPLTTLADNENTPEMVGEITQPF